MHRNRLGLLVALGALVSVIGCKCNDKTVSVDRCKDVPGVQSDNFAVCTSSAECGDHYACADVKDQQGVQCCLFVDRKCNSEADCCPGQTCPSDRKKCFDKFLSCETDADCGDNGDRFCVEYTDSYGTSKRCQLKPCSALGTCPEGQACFQGECLADLPCGGSCEPGKACVASIDRCQDYASPNGRSGATCPVSCAPGSLATFKDGRNIWDTCRLPDVQCVCAELPPLRSDDLGRFSALATDPAKGQIWVSAYDGQYGDLVVMRFNASGQLTRTDYVDGVPSGAPQYGPSGPRGGIVEAGPDVGRYTDIALSGDHTYVSYYDATNGDLKLATRAGESGWTTMTVDGATADLGLYSSIGVDSEGFPAISYFQRGGKADFDASACPAPAPTGDKSYITALKLARATTKTPTSASDFVIKTIACQSRPVPPCTGCSQVCADPGTGPSCYASATACSACDTNTETCVMVGNTATCAKKYNPSQLQEVPDGVGLFSSLTLDGKDALIAYMRRTNGEGDLYGVKVTSQGSVGSRVVLDSAGDTGWFPDIKLDPGTQKVAISYHDFTSRQLKYYYNVGFAAGVASETVDPGTGAQGSGESNWVGSDSALMFGSGGKVYAVYQDATRGDLKLAQRTTQGWKILPPIRTEGAVGFFADGALLNDKLFVSHARIRARQVGGEARVANTLLLDHVAAPAD